MSMHPTLTLTVYIIIGVVLLGVFAYMFFYTRGLKAKGEALKEKGRLPITKEEGIAIATRERERTGRTGSL